MTSIIQHINERKKQIAVSPYNKDSSPIDFNSYAWPVSDDALASSTANAPVIGSINEEEKSIPFCITELIEDRDGDIILPKGIMTHNYVHNPVVFFGHQSWEVPIGIAKKDGELKLWKTDTKAFSTCYFDKEDEDAMFIFSKVKRGILSATSIAFVPIRAYPRDEYPKKAYPRKSEVIPPGWLFEEVDLTEWSIVGVPSNAGAIRDALDSEKSFISPKLQKALVPFAAKSKGRCFGGPCPTTKDYLSGGLADLRKPEDFDQEQLAAGIKVEMEHTDSEEIAREIAMDHLSENPLYYIELQQIEKDASGKPCGPGQNPERDNCIPADGSGGGGRNNQSQQQQTEQPQQQVQSDGEITIDRFADNVTHEGVSLEQAKTLTREQSKKALTWQNNMTLIADTNTPNKDLPNETRPKLDDVERGALQKYTYKNDRILNGMLRGFPPGIEDEAIYSNDFYHEMKTQMDSAFEKAPVMDKPITTVRGMNIPEDAFKKFVANVMEASKNDGSVKFDGYTSTTRPNALTQFMQKIGVSDGIKKVFRGNVSLKINAVHGLDMKPYSQLTGESEILLPEGSEFKVKGFKLHKNKKGDVVGISAELDQIPKKKSSTEKTYSRKGIIEKAEEGKSDSDILQEYKTFYEGNPEHLERFCDQSTEYIHFKKKGKKMKKAAGPKKQVQDKKWNKSLPSVFEKRIVFADEIEEPSNGFLLEVTGEIVPADTIIDIAKKYLRCEIKDIFDTSELVPSVRMGTYLTGLQMELSKYVLNETRNIFGNYQGGKEKPPVYDTIQLNSKMHNTFLLEGIQFFQDKSNPSMRFLLERKPSWNGISLELYCRKQDADVLNGIFANSGIWAKQNNFLKNEAFALSGEFLENTGETWDDVFLEKKNESCLQLQLDRFNKKQNQYANRGIILTGDPGNGKTLSGRVMRNKCKGTFIWISSRDFHYSGSFGGISMGFEMAKELAPSILFIEDVDNWLHETTIDLIKTEMDGIAQSKGILTVLTTNFPQRLPKALIDRPGRFHDVLLFNSPNEKAKTNMLSRWLPELGKSEIRNVLERTVGYSGAHIYELCNYVKTLIENDDLDINQATLTALDKIEEQKDLIRQIQLSGSNYKHFSKVKEMPSLKKRKAAQKKKKNGTSFKKKNVPVAPIVKKQGCGCPKEKKCIKSKVPALVKLGYSKEHSVVIAQELCAKSHNEDNSKVSGYSVIAKKLGIKKEMDEEEDGYIVPEEDEEEKDLEDPDNDNDDDTSSETDDDDDYIDLENIDKDDDSESDEIDDDSESVDVDEELEDLDDDLEDIEEAVEKGNYPLGAEMLAKTVQHFRDYVSYLDEGSNVLEQPDVKNYFSELRGMIDGILEKVGDMSSELYPDMDMEKIIKEVSGTMDEIEDEFEDDPDFEEEKDDDFDLDDDTEDDDFEENEDAQIDEILGKYKNKKGIKTSKKYVSKETRQKACDSMRKAAEFMDDMGDDDEIPKKYRPGFKYHSKELNDISDEMEGGPAKRKEEESPVEEDEDILESMKSLLNRANRVFGY